MRLRPGRVDEFVRILESEITSVLRRQQGFRAYITFIVPEGTEAVGISFWDRGDDLNAYLCNGYPDVLMSLAQVMMDAPRIQTREVSNMTFHVLEGVKTLAELVEKAPQFQLFEVSKPLLQKIAGHVAA
jgi:hypothetical protein